MNKADNERKLITMTAVLMMAPIQTEFSLFFCGNIHLAIECGEYQLIFFEYFTQSIGLAQRLQ